MQNAERRTRDAGGDLRRISGAEATSTANSTQKLEPAPTRGHGSVRDCTVCKYNGTGADGVLSST